MVLWSAAADSGRVGSVTSQDMTTGEVRSNGTSSMAGVMGGPVAPVGVIERGVASASSIRLMSMARALYAIPSNPEVDCAKSEQTIKLENIF